MTPCPSRAQLEQFLLESLGTAEYLAVEKHLAACTACQGVLEQLTRDDAADHWRELQQQPSPDATPPPLQQVLGQLLRDSFRGKADALTASLVLPSLGQTKVRSAAERTDVWRRSWPTAPGYEVLGELGRGGMGVVYKARQTSLNRLVALKMVLRGSHAGADEVARLRREAETVAQLKHPNIVQVYEVGELDGLPYLCLEYVEGSNLAQVLAGRPQDPRESAELIETLARAMHAAHQQGIVHRDLKPANILLQKKPTTDNTDNTDRFNNASSLSVASVLSVVEFMPKITDFGLARQLDHSQSLSRSGTIAGTPSYMAPEQVTGAKTFHGPTGDVYSLGAILYEMLTGRPPFRAEGTYETLLQVAHQDAVPPRQLRSRLPRDLETICLKCLHKDPARRYQSAFALAEDLRRFLEHRPISARPLGPVGRTLKGIRRRPTTAALLATLAVAVTLAFALVLVQWSLAEEQAASERAKTASEQAKTEEEKKALAKEQADRRKVQGLTATLLLDEGLARCDRGDIGPGLLSFARCLELATAAADKNLQGAARNNLAAWAAQYARPRGHFAHPSWVWDACLSADKQILYTGCYDKFVRRWDVATGKVIGDPLPHKQPVWSIALHPGGKLLLSGAGPGKGPGGDTGEVQVWDLTTGQALLSAPLKHRSTVTYVAFNPQGDKFLTVCSYSAQVWSTATQTRLLQLRPRLGTIVSGRWSPDGRLIATLHTDGKVWLCDAATGKGVRFFRQEDAIQVFAFSPNGQRLATGGRSYTQVWDVASGQPVGEPLLHRGRVQAVTFSSDSRRLATASLVLTFMESAQDLAPQGAEVQVWYADSGKPASLPWPHASEVWALAFSRDGELLLTGSMDGSARLFTCATGRPFGGPLTTSGNVRLVAFVADGRTILTASAGSRAALWELPPKTHATCSLPPWIETRALAFSPSGERLLLGCADGQARFWDVAGKKLIGNPLTHGGPIQAVAWCARGKQVLTAGGATVRLWDTAGRLVREFPHVGERITALAVAPDGATFATGTYDGYVRLWEIETGRLRGRPWHPERAISQLAFDPDGRVLHMSSNDDNMLNWNVGSGKALSYLDSGQALRRFAVSPDGKRLVTADCFSAEIQLWDRATNRLTTPPLAGINDRSVLFSPDSRLILAGGHQGIRLWDAATGKRVGPDLKNHVWIKEAGNLWGPWGQLGALAIDPRGRLLAVGQGTALEFWELSGPAAGSVEQVRHWVMDLTALEMDAQGAIRSLTTGAREANRQWLAQKGTPAP